MYFFLRGKPEHEIQKRTERKKQAEMGINGQKLIGIIEQAEQDRQNRTGSAGQAEVDRQNWTGRIGQAGNWIGGNREAEQLPGRGC